MVFCNFPVKSHNSFLAGIINLKTCTEVKEREPIKGHKFTFDICTEERVYHLASETEEERREWLDTLNTLLFEEPQKHVCLSVCVRCRFCVTNKHRQFMGDFPCRAGGSKCV